MSVVGIIAEYNPFHSGHEYLINQARILAKNDPIIVLMSGNYVQRGQMAITDKWTRAKAALNSGADLVFELPFSYAVQPADIFSNGSVEIISKLGCTDLVFGVEDSSLNFEYLANKISKIPKSSFDFRDYSQSYATQYNDLISREVGHEINQPNMILAIAYAVANLGLKQPLKLHPISRIGSGHDDILVRENVVSSATSLRNHILKNNDLKALEAYIPKEELIDLSKQLVFPNWNIIYKFLKYRLESASTDELHDIYQMNEGLEFKMKEEIHNSVKYADFLKYIKSKRYTYARLRRLSLYTLLNVHKGDMGESLKNPSTLLLGYSERGSKYLKKVRKDISIPIISRVDKKNTANGTLGLQIKVDRLFEQVYGKNQNFAHKPIEVK